MDSLFFLQLVASFFAGGFLIALLGYISERSSERVAGIVLSIPSTVAISFLFIGWAIGVEGLVKGIPATLATAGLAQVFMAVYIYLARIPAKKSFSMTLSICGALLTFVLLFTPAAIFEIQSTPTALLLSAGGVLVGYLLLTKYNMHTPPQKLITYTPIQQILRAVFAGTVIATAVFLSKVLSPFWGGVMSAFPAVFATTLVILHYYYGTDMLFKVAKTVPAGSLVYIAFTAVSLWTFPLFGLWGGLIASYLCAATVFLPLYLLSK